MLTSTTAPGKTFASRAELAEHYKSDWHKYNLKRREAGLPLLEEADFRARWEAALAMRKEKEAKMHAGTGHLKNKDKARNKKAKQKQLQQQQEEQTASTAPVGADGDMVVEEPRKKISAELAASQENPDIDPKQSLFDNHTSETLKENVEYMQRKFGFFLPDKGKVHRPPSFPVATIIVLCVHVYWSFFS